MPRRPDALQLGRRRGRQATSTAPATAAWPSRCRPPLPGPRCRARRRERLLRRRRLSLTRRAVPGRLIPATHRHMPPGGGSVACRGDRPARVPLGVATPVGQELDGRPARSPAEPVGRGWETTAGCDRPARRSSLPTAMPRPSSVATPTRTHPRRCTPTVQHGGQPRAWMVAPSTPRRCFSGSGRRPQPGRPAGRGTPRAAPPPRGRRRRRR